MHWWNGPTAMQGEIEMGEQLQGKNQWGWDADGVFAMHALRPSAASGCTKPLAKRRYWSHNNGAGPSAGSGLFHQRQSKQSTESQSLWDGTKNVSAANQTQWKEVA